MAKQIKCVFKRVNGDLTGVFARSGKSQNAASYGVLYMKNCPDGKTFYCDTEGSENSFYRLLNPENYKLSGWDTTTKPDVWVWLDISFLESREEIEIVDEVSEESSDTIQETVEPSPPPRQLNRYSYELDFGAIDVKEPGVNSDDTRGFDESDSLYGMSPSQSTSFVTDYNFVTQNLGKIRNNLNIVGSTNSKTYENNLFTKFNRYLIPDPNIELSKTFAHVFFTRPDLNLYDENGALLTKVANNAVFYYLNQNYPMLLKSLTKKFTDPVTHLATTHYLNPFLSNMAKSFELSDEYIDSVEHGETYTGHKVKYGKHNIKSKTAGNFSISYNDTKDFHIYKIHKAWVDYISNVYRGIFDAYWYNIQNRILDYACSVYYFLCGPDGETILFWTKYTGVFPTTIPSSASSWSHGTVLNRPSYNINYEYAWKDDFNPIALGEFNTLTKGAGHYNYAKTYESSLGSTGVTYVNAPFVETRIDNSGRYTFALRYRKN